MADQTETEIQALVRASIQSRVVEALKSTPEAIDAMVAAAFNKPVDPDTGRHDGYGRKVPYLEWLAGDTIRMVARSSISQIIEEMRPQIEAEIRKRFTEGTIADALVAAILKDKLDDWRVNVSFETDRR